MKVRRAEYRRKRNAKRGWRRRHPLRRILKDLYSDLRINLYPLTTPLIAKFAQSDRANDGSPRWGGVSYFDVVVSGPPTTRVTSKGVVPVNYGEPGAATWRGKY